MIDVREYLRRIEKINELISGIYDEIEQWKTIATKTTATVKTVKIGNEKHVVEKVQYSGSSDPMGDAVCEYTDLEAELEAEKGRLIAEKQEIISTIKMLSAREYKLLRLMYVGKVARCGGSEYITYFTLKQAASEMHISRRTASGIHGSALNNLRKILSGREENENQS